jgi:hypothetical protein
LVIPAFGGAGTCRRIAGETAGFERNPVVSKNRFG